MKLSVFVLLACLSASLAFGADEPVAKINGRIAHPTHIIAKSKPGGAAQALARQAATAYKITAEPSTMPGLIIMDSIPALAAQAVQTPEELGVALSKRIADLEATGNFTFVEPDYLREIDATPTDSAFNDGTLWGLNNTGQGGGKFGADLNVVRAWDKTIGNSNIIVAVIDSGVHYTHQDLRDQMWHNKLEIPGNGIDDDGNGLVDDVVGYDFFDGDADPDDVNGHGTHVSGTIGAKANGGGLSVGVVWNTQIMALRVGNRFLSTAAIIRSINYAILNGAKIINCSFGGYFNDPAELDAFTAARTAGLLVVVAAGNDSNDNDVIPFYPSSFDLDNIISVAAIDRNDQLADFSSFGLTSVDIAAPGVDIFSTWNTSDTAYNTISGTSMASPHTAGSVALIWAAMGPSTPYSQVKKRLLDGASQTVALKNMMVTGGRVNVFRSLLGSADGILEITVSPGADVLLPSNTTLPIEVNVSDDLAVTDATVTGTFAGLPSTIRFVQDTNAASGASYIGLISTPAIPGSYVLSIHVTAPRASDYNTNITYSVVFPPANDDFAKAEKIPAAGAVVKGDNTLAKLKKETSEPNHGGLTNTSGSLWYSWSPATTDPVIIDTTGSGLDLVLAVYRGTSLATLVPVASIGSTNANKYVIFTPKTAGITYSIAVAGARTNALGSFRFRLEPKGLPDTVPPLVAITSPVSGTWITSTNGKVTVSGTASDPVPNSSGLQRVFVKQNGGDAVSVVGSNIWSVTLTLSTNNNGDNTIEAFATDFAENVSTIKSKINLTYRPQASSDNDLFANATPLSPDLPPTERVVTANNSGASIEFNEPKHAGNEGGHSLWYSFTSTMDGILFLSTDGSAIDTLLGVYTGTVIPRPVVSELTTLASSDDVVGEKFSEVVTAIKAGTTYFIAVDGYGGAAGNLVLSYGFTTGEVFRITISTNGLGSVSPRSGNFPKNSTVTFAATPATTNQFVQWETTNGVAFSTINPLSLAVTNNASIVARFGPATYIEDFESGGLTNLSWVSIGWVVEPTPATLSDTRVITGGQMLYSANSGINPDRHTNSLSLGVNLEAGTGSFNYLVNCEQFFDRLTFKLNGLVLGTWTGVASSKFETFSFDVVTNGFYKLEWSYIKDNAIASGADKAFIDAIQLPITKQLVTQESGLVVMGGISQAVTIESSTDMVHWDEEVNGTGTTDLKGFFRSKVVPTSGQTTKFYRARFH